MRAVLFSLCLACSFLISAAEPLNTPSGKPEVFIPDVTKKEVADCVVARMSAKGARILRATDYQVVGEVDIDNILMSLVAGSAYNATPANRTTYTIIEKDGGVQLFMSVDVITNPGSNFEKRTPMDTKKIYRQLQDSLEAFKARFLPGAEGACTRGGDRSSASPLGGASGFILIESSPIGADLLLDGNFIAQTPYRIKGLQLSPGVHTLEVSKPGYEIWTRKMEFFSDASVSIKAELIPLK